LAVGRRATGVGVEIERQVIGGLDGGEEAKSLLADTAVGEVDRVPQDEVAADAGEAAAGSIWK